MKVLFLAAGYGTRLERDILADPSRRYHHLLGLPKALIPISGRPLLSHWVEILSSVPSIAPDDFYVVTNSHFVDQFRQFAQRSGIPIENVIDDGSKTNDRRLGAIRDIELVIRQAKIRDDLMVVGGDTLFFHDFDAADVLRTFCSASYSTVLWYPTVETEKTGILVTDSNQLVTTFLEKPHPSSTSSRQACPCFYIYKQAALPVIEQYVRDAKSLAEVDAPGQLVRYCCEREPRVRAVRISGRFDIGGLDTYIECEEFYRREKWKKYAKWVGVVAALGAVVGVGWKWYTTTKQIHGNSTSGSSSSR